MRRTVPWARSSAGACWPTAQQELWLRAALLPREAALTAWRRAALSRTAETPDGTVDALLPLVYWNLARSGESDEPLAALKERYLLTWRENQRLLGYALPLLARLEEAGVDVVVLKGLALIARFARDPGLRPMADVDVLVPASEVDRASAIAVDLGWQPRHRVTPGFRRVKHAAPFDHRAGVACDVHWRVFEEPGGGTADDEFRAAAETVVFQGTRLRVPTPADQLLHTCGHAARWAPGPGIHWVADAMHIVRAGSIDWKRLVGQAVQRRFVLRMRHMLAYLRQALEAPIPADVEADLARRRVSPLERLEHRVRSRERRVLGEFAAYVFNCARGERHPLLAFPGYLRDAWDLPSTGRVLPHALALVARRVGAAMARGD